MVLVLTVMQCPNSVLGEQRLIQSGGFVLGRGSECDWTLPDPERKISNRHCALELSEGSWLLRDLSTNGTFLNNAPEAIGRGQMRPLRDGDRVRLGAYELECRVKPDTTYGAATRPPADMVLAPIAPPAQHADIFSAPLPGLSPPGGMERGFAQLPPGELRPMPPMPPSRDADIFAAPPLGFSPTGASPGRFTPMPPVERNAIPAMQLSSEVDIFSAHLPGLSPAGGQQGGHAPVLPTDFDPFGPLDAGPAMPDNRPVLQDVFTPPRATMPDLLPGDWAATPAPAGQTHIGSAPLPPAEYSPFASMQAGLGMPAPSLNPQEVPTSPQAQMPSLIPDDWDLSPMPAPAARGTLNIPVAQPSNPFAAAPAPMAAPMAAPMPAMAQPLPAFTALHPPQAAPQAMMAPLDTSMGMGLQVPNPSPATPQTISDHQTAVALLSAAVAGMRALLTASEDARRALGNTQSILPSNAGDPLRFAASDEALPMAMLGGVGASAGAGNPGARPGTVDDFNAHKLATMAASKAAARALLARLAPAALEAEGSSSDFMPGAREKRLWKSYKRLHQQLADEFDDDFDFAFRRAFDQAYEEACKMLVKGSR